MRVRFPSVQLPSAPTRRILAQQASVLRGMFYTNFDTMSSQLSMAPESSVAQAQAPSSPIRFVSATFHGQDWFGRNTTSREILAVSAKATLEDWLVSFEELAFRIGRTHHLRDVAIAYRHDGLEKRPTVWEYVQNCWRPVFGLRFVDMPTW